MERSMGMEAERRSGTFRQRLLRSEAVRRWAVASRVLAAVVGGYLLTSLATALLGLLLPGPRAQAVLAATMLSFALYAALIMWAFAARSVRRVWLGMAVASAICGAGLWLAQRLATWGTT